MNTIRLMLVTSFGLGFLRPAPGTWGSMPPVAMYALMLAFDSRHQAREVSILLVLVVFSAACLVCGAWAERRFGGKDASHIVADETAGQCLPLLFLPAAAFGGAPLIPGIPGVSLTGLATLATAFVLFRIMDIAKPPPARGLQRLGGGLGVLIDDLFAGAYAAILMQIGTRVLLPLLFPVP